VCSCAWKNRSAVELVHSLRGLRARLDLGIECHSGLDPVRWTTPESASTPTSTILIVLVGRSH